MSEGEQEAVREHTYLGDAEFEVQWIKTHRRHNVAVGAGNWLVCRTCGIPLKLTTLDAFKVVQEIQK